MQERSALSQNILSAQKQRQGAKLKAPKFNIGMPAESKNDVERISRTDHLGKREDIVSKQFAEMGIDPSTSFSSQASNSQRSENEKQTLKRSNPSTRGFSESVNRLYMVRCPFNVATVKLGRTKDSLENLLKRYSFNLFINIKI